jgi:hypothetical protein
MPEPIRSLERRHVFCWGEWLDDTCLVPMVDGHLVQLQRGDMILTEQIGEGPGSMIRLHDHRPRCPH